MALYIQRNRGLGQFSDDMGFVPNQILMQKTFPFIVSGTLACVRMHVYMYACPRVFVAFIFQR